jgi:peroxiredoxin
MSDWIEQGQKAPAFSLASDDGNKVKLSDFAGKPVVLYFYPKDDTPGCTREACAFRDASAPLKKAGAVVLGVSADDTASHVKFRDKYKLNFPLLFGHRSQGGRKVWRLARKKHVRQNLHGNPAEHLPDRSSRQSCQGLETRPSRRPRPKSARSPQRAFLIPLPCTRGRG